MTDTVKPRAAQAEQTVKSLLAEKDALETQLRERDSAYASVVDVNKRANIKIAVLEQRLKEEMDQNVTLRVMLSEQNIADQERQQREAEAAPLPPVEEQ